MAHVVVLGGGFGGLAAARELKGLLPDAQITLVAGTDHFYMGFAKLWDLAGYRPLSGGTIALSELERSGIGFQKRLVTAIDPGSRRVETTGGVLEADALLVALGAGPSPAHLELLDGDRSFDLYDGNALPGIHRALDEITEGTVMVSILGVPFKCPPAPFEAALIVDEVLRRRGVRDSVDVVVSTPAPITLPVAGPDASRYVAGHLAAHGIELLAEHKVVGVDADRTVRFGNGATREFGVLLGVPANVAPDVIGSSGLAGPLGWIEPDRLTMRTGFELVYAAGDCTAIPAGKGHLPKAGVFAAAQGRVAARNIAADLGGGGREEFDGKGFCFLELPGQVVAYVEGNWYADPAPEVHLTDADSAQFQRKLDYERSRLQEWFSPAG